jgi:RHS repeat-associated protein
MGEYIYDGDGNRLQKTENSITTTYIHSGINSIYEENSTGSVGYIYGPTGLIAKRTTIDQESNTYFYHKDHLGSTRLVTDSSKNIITASTYNPFGETDVEEGSEHYLYNGKEKDAIDLYYYGARYYDPQIGRFITRDVKVMNPRDPQGLNKYSYCRNNPLVFIDPDGRIERKFTMDISRQSYSTYYLSYLFLGDTPQLSILTQVEKKKNNIEVIITAKLNSKTGYGAGNLCNTKVNVAEIIFLDPEGIKIDPDSSGIDLNDLTTEGLEYTIEVYNDQGALVGYDFAALLSEENSEVIITITITIDPSSIEGKDIKIRITITLGGAASPANNSEIITIESDETLPENVSIC